MLPQRGWPKLSVEVHYWLITIEYNHTWLILSWEGLCCGRPISLRLLSYLTISRPDTLAHSCYGEPDRRPATRPICKPVYSWKVHNAWSRWTHSCTVLLASLAGEKTCVCVCVCVCVCLSYPAHFSHLMHQLLKPLLLGFDLDELLELGVGCGSLSLHLLNTKPSSTDSKASEWTASDLHVQRLGAHQRRPTGNRKRTHQSQRSVCVTPLFHLYFCPFSFRVLRF